MKKIYLNSFASLVGKRDERSLVKAMMRMIEDHPPLFWYSRIRAGVREFFVKGCDYSVLSEQLDKLDAVVPLTPFQKNDVANSKQAVRMIMGVPFSFLKGKTMQKPDTKSIPFYGIELDVNPDAIIMWNDSGGGKHVGAIKTKLRKSYFRLIEGEMIACMLKCYLQSLFPDCIVEDDYCLCFDAFRGRFYKVTDFRKNHLFASAIAKRIALMDHDVA